MRTLPGGGGLRCTRETETEKQMLLVVGGDKRDRKEERDSNMRLLSHSACVFKFQQREVKECIKQVPEA